MSALLPRPLRGIVPPLVSPLMDRDTLHAAGLGLLIEHVLAGGVHGIFLLGTTGEGPNLSQRLRREVLEQACGRVAGRLPVLVGITDTSFVEALSMARFAERCAAQAVVYAGPCYAPVTQAELLAHIERLAGESPLPLFLYNMPSHTHVAFEVRTVEQAAQLPNVAGLKDSSGDLPYFQRLAAALAARPDFSLLIGPEELLGPALTNGAHGGVCGGANLFPQLYVRLYEAATMRNTAEMARLQAIVLRVSEGLYRLSPAGSSYLRGLKCALASLGLCSDFVAEPYTRLTEQERRRIAGNLQELAAAISETDHLLSEKTAGRGQGGPGPARAV
jgi:dihydrodipicolinate synthase/N-acetylneuraminate lyase